MPSAVEQLLSGQRQGPSSAVDRLLASRQEPTTSVDKLLASREFDPDEFTRGNVLTDTLKGVASTVGELGKAAVTNPFEVAKGIGASLGQTASIPINYAIGEDSEIRESVAAIANQVPAITKLPFVGPPFQHAQQMQGERGLKLPSRVDEFLERERQEAIGEIQEDIDRPTAKAAVPRLMLAAELIGVPEVGAITAAKLATRGVRAGSRLLRSSDVAVKSARTSEFLKNLASPSKRAAEVAAATGRDPGDVMRAATTEMRNLESARKINSSLATDADLSPAVAREFGIGRKVDIKAPDDVPTLRQMEADLGGPPEIVPNGEIIDTAGQGLQFHGSAVRGELPVTEGHYAPRSVYGQGFYTTDSAEKAVSYANRGGDVFRIEEKAPVRMLDLDEPVPEWLWNEFADRGTIRDFTIDPSNARTLGEVYDVIRREDLPADEIQEYFDGIRAIVEEAGYRGYKHKGGVLTSTSKHDVKIYFNPERDLLPPIKVPPGTLRRVRITDPVSGVARSKVARHSPDPIVRLQPVVDPDLLPVVDDLYASLADDVAHVSELTEPARRRIREILPELAESNPAMMETLAKNPQAAEQVLARANIPYLPGTEKKGLVSFGRWANAQFMRWMAPEGAAYEHAWKVADPEGRSFLQKGIQRLSEGHQNIAKSIQREAYGVRRDLEKAMSDAVRSGDWDGSIGQLNRQLQQVRETGNRAPLDELPPALVEQFERSEAVITRWTEEMAGLGLFDAKTLDQVQDLAGKYVHRSYRLFRDPEYAKQLEGSVQWDRMKAWLMRELTDGDADAAERYMYDLVNGRIDQDKAKAAWAKITGSRPKDKLEGPDLYTIIERQDVPKPVRNFMGEVREYTTNFDITADLISHDIAATTVQSLLVDDLVRMGMAVDEETKIARGLNNWQRKAFGRGPTEQEFYLLPEAKAALETMEETTARVLKDGFWRSLTGAVKVGKVHSPPTIARNYGSGIFFGLTSGQAVKPRFWGDFGRSTARSLRVSSGGSLSPADLAEESFLTRLGVLQQDPVTGELETYMKQAGSGRLGRGFRRVAKYTPERVRDTVAAARKAVARAFVEGDSAWKRAVFWGHKDDYTRAVKAAEGDPAALTKIREAYGTIDPTEIAAETTRRVTQTYSRAPLFSRKLSQHPLFGPFATFPAVSAQNYMYAWRELGREARLGAELSGEAGAAFRAMAARRATGLMTMHAVPVAAKKGMEAVTEGTYTDDQQQALNRIASKPWNKFSNKFFFSTGEGWKNLAYYDWGTVDYFESVRDPQRLLLEYLQSGDATKLADVSEFLTDQFASYEIPAKATAEVVTNRRLSSNLVETGREFYGGGRGFENVDRHLTAGEKTKQLGYGVYRSLTPGAFSWFENVARAAGNELGFWENEDPFGIERRSTAREAWPFGRMVEVDMEREVRGFSGWVNDKTRTGTINRALERGDMKLYNDLLKKAEKATWPEIRSGLRDLALVVPKRELKRNMSMPDWMLNLALSDKSEAESAELFRRRWAPRPPNASLASRLRAAREDWE